MTKSLVFALLPAIIVLSCSRDAKQVATGQKQVTSAVRMQQFVKDISRFCKKQDPKFAIIPQNASELAFENGDPDGRPDKQYLNAIDAFGIEGLFYNGEYTPDSTRISTLQKLQPLKKILVSEYLDADRNVADAIAKTTSHGFIPFIRTHKNYNYELIPKHVREENSAVVSSIKDVKNYLYLINASKYGSKQEFLEAIGKTNHDLIIIDLFFDNEDWRAPEVEQMRRKANGGRRMVVCYLNIGSAENWRYYWKRNWKIGSPSFLEKPYEGYNNEFWVNFWEPQWQEIIFGNDDSYASRILKAGFDGAYLDNVEAYHYIFK